MKTLGIVCVSLIACALMAGSAPAQMRASRSWSFPSQGLSGFWHPTVGTAAFYQVQDKQNKTTRSFDFAIISQETVQGKNAVWVEFTFSGEQRGAGVGKELVFFDPVKMQLQVFKGVIQMPGKPAMEIPDAFLQQAHPIQFNDARADSQDLGKESVTTPAGTFSCEHYKENDGSSEFWVSTSVVPIGLVKSVDKDGETTTLVKTTSNAIDKIKGAVQPFDPMLLAPDSER
jgi:hypothetical protein